MATNFPTSLDNGTTLPNPNATDKTNSPSHAGLHDNENAALIAIQTKLGTGSSTASSGTVLRGTGSGASAFGQINVTTDVASFTSANLRSLLSDETGSGSAVFANTPTLITPAVDTITESTPSNGVTVAGLSLKSGKLNTNNSVVTANITNAAVTADKLSTGVTYNAVATDQTTTSASYTDLATVGPAVTVTVGANGLALAIWGAGLYTTAARKSMSVAVSGATTTAASDTYRIVKDDAAFSVTQSRSFLFTGLNAGSTTFTAKYNIASGTGNFFDRWLVVIPL